jgi:hypothetical protein
MWPTHAWLMVQVGFWLCGLPLRLWVCPLPTLLRRLTSARRTRPRGVAVDDAVRTVVRVYQAGLFRLPIYPRACLRQALALYYVMSDDPTPSGGFPQQPSDGVRSSAAPQIPDAISA